VSELILRPANYFLVPVLDRFYPTGGELPGFGLIWEKTKGRIHFLPGELSIWSGMSSHGKSIILNQVCLDAVTHAMTKTDEVGERCGIFSFEMPPRDTLYRLIRQATGERQPSEETIAECMDWLSDRVYVFPEIGTRKLSTIIPVIKRGIEELGVTQVVIDSLMKLGMGVDDYNGQKEAMDALQTLSQQTGVHIHVVAHAKKKEDEKVRPGKMDVKGTSEITDLANNVYTVWRNKGKENALLEYATSGTIPKDEKGRALDIFELKQSYDAVIDFCKSREFGSEAEGRYGLFFHPASMQYHEKSGQEPYRYYYPDAPPF
jgi:twinkle protein